MADTMPSYNSVTLTKEERLRRKAESTDPIPIRLTNNYAFHRVFKKPEVCKGFLMALLHLKETDIRSVDVADPIKEGGIPRQQRRHPGYQSTPEQRQENQH